MNTEEKKLQRLWLRERELLGPIESVEQLASGYHVESWVMARMLADAQIIASNFAYRSFPEPAYVGKGSRSVWDNQFA